MLANSSLIAFVATQDLERARVFYGAALGLALNSESPFALEFDAAGTMLRITGVAEINAAPYTVLGWRVANIREAVAALARKGIVFELYAGMLQDGLSIWSSPSGVLVAWFKDPDGNVLSLTEFPES